MNKFSGMNMNQLAQFAVDNEQLSSSDYMDYASAIIVVSFKEHKLLVDQNTKLLEMIVMALDIKKSAGAVTDKDMQLIKEMKAELMNSMSKEQLLKLFPKKD